MKREKKRGVFKTGNLKPEQTKAIKENSNSNNKSGYTVSETGVSMSDQDAVSASRRSSVRKSQVLDLDSIMVGIEEYLNNNDSDHEQITDGRNNNKNGTDVPVNIIEDEQYEENRNVIDLTSKNEDNSKNKDKNENESGNGKKSFDDETLPTTQESSAESKDNLNQLSTSSNLSGETPISTQGYIAESETESLASRVEDPTKNKELQNPASIQNVEKGMDVPTENTGHVKNDQGGRNTSGTGDGEPVKQRLSDDKLEHTTSSFKDNGDHSRKVGNPEKTAKNMGYIENKVRLTEDSEEVLKSTEHLQDKTEPAKDPEAAVKGPEEVPKSTEHPQDKTEPAKDAKQSTNTAEPTKSAAQESSKDKESPIPPQLTEDKMESPNNTEKKNNQRGEAPTASEPAEDNAEPNTHPKEKNKQLEETLAVVEPAEDNNKENKQLREAESSVPASTGRTENKAQLDQQHGSDPRISVDNSNTRYFKSGEEQDGYSVERNAGGDLPESHMHTSENSAVSSTSETLKNSAEQHAPQSHLAYAEGRDRASLSGESFSEDSRTENHKSDKLPTNTPNHREPIISDTKIRGGNDVIASDSPKIDANSDKCIPDVTSDMSGQIYSEIERNAKGQEHHEGAFITPGSYALDSEYVTKGAVVHGDQQDNAILSIEGTRGAAEISAKEETGADAEGMSPVTHSNTINDSNLRSTGTSHSLPSSNTVDADESAEKQEASNDSDAGSTCRDQEGSKVHQETPQETNTIVNTEQEHQEEQPQSPIKVDLDTQGTSDKTKATLPLAEEKHQKQTPGTTDVVDPFPTAENNSPPTQQDFPQTSALDAETEAILKGLDNPEELLRDLESDRRKEPVFIFTSLAGGGFHIIPRTNRLATILQANRIEFSYRDLGTDPQARNLWKAHASGKQLPGLVRGSDVVGNWQDVEDANEEYRLGELLYGV